VPVEPFYFIICSNWQDKQYDLIHNPVVYVQSSTAWCIMST